MDVVFVINSYCERHHDMQQIRLFVLLEMLERNTTWQSDRPNNILHSIYMNIMSELIRWMVRKMQDKSK